MELSFLNMKKIILILLFIVVLGVGSFVLMGEEGMKVPEEEEKEKELREIVEGFIGTPYERGPLGEGDDEKLYREDVFDCTTLVLVSVSKLHSNDLSPEEMIKKVNYFPPGEVSYETRLHFSTYRNKVSEFFEDITSGVAPELRTEREVLLNKKRDEEGRLIDIDWEEEIVIPYIKKEDVTEVIPDLPEEVGVAFLMDGDEEMGLDVRHEGFLFKGEELVHASLEEGEVVRVDFFEFLEESDYDGVNFFKVNY